MQPKLTGLEVLEMEVGTTTATLEEKQPGSGDQTKDGAGKGPTPPGGSDPKSQSGKPAPERQEAGLFCSRNRDAIGNN